MAKYHVTTDEIALVAATRKTLLEITAGAGDRLDITEAEIGFDSSASAESAVIEMVRKTATITGAASPPTPTKDDPADGAANATVKHNASAEGTNGDILRRWEVPVGGGKHIMLPLGEEIKVPLSGIIAIMATSPVVVNAVAGMGFRE